MTFRQPQVILRAALGSYVNGEWIQGARSVLNITASVQPVKGEEVMTMPEGKRLADFVKIYTSTEIVPLIETIGQAPDQLQWHGHTYECIEVNVRQMDVINHYKAIFAKVSQL